MTIGQFQHNVAVVWLSTDCSSLKLSSTLCALQMCILRWHTWLNTKQVRPLIFIRPVMTLSPENCKHHKNSHTFATSFMIVYQFSSVIW